MDSWATAFARAADAAGPSAGRWFLIGLGVELVAALIYGYYRLLSRTSLSYGGSIVLVSAIGAVVVGVVFMVVALVMWIGSLT